MAADSWIGKHLTSRSGRLAVFREHRRAYIRKRAWSRKVARAMLIASMLVLGVLAVEIGRKAVTILSHGAFQPTVDLEG